VELSGIKMVNYTDTRAIDNSSTG